MPFDFSETPFIKVKVWVSKPVGVSIKLQNYPDWGQGHEQMIEVTETNTWVEVIFNYGFCIVWICLFGFKFAQYYAK
mgnify:CR=1 FL=1